jgi:hypothetical protein
MQHLQVVSSWFLTPVASQSFSSPLALSLLILLDVLEGRKSFLIHSGTDDVAMEKKIMKDFQSKSCENNIGKLSTRDET